MNGRFDEKITRRLFFSMVPVQVPRSYAESFSYRAGLCIEEMAGNIVRHGFTGKANSVVDICVVKEDEGLIIKMKDNCRLFNPAEIDDILDQRVECILRSSYFLFLTLYIISSATLMAEVMSKSSSNTECV